MIDAIDHLKVPVRPVQEDFVPTSLQFSIIGLEDARIKRFIEEVDARGVHVKWFGAPEPIGFTSRHDHWRYLAEHKGTSLPNADRVMRGLCDIRLPVWLSETDCKTIATVVREAMENAARR